MFIFVDEEYGVRSWLWEYPGTPEELIADWKAGLGPFLLPKSTKMRGTIKQVSQRTNPGLSPEDIQGYAMVGGVTEDVFLEVQGFPALPHPGWDKVLNPG